MLKAYYLYRRSLIFNSLCAYSSKEVCTSIFWKSISFLEIRNECNTYFSYISNIFFTPPICSQLYNCSNGASSYICKLLTKLEWIRTFLTPTKIVLLIIICVPIVYRGIGVYRGTESVDPVLGVVLLLYAPFVLYFPWIVNFYVWHQLFFGFWYNTCISISDISDYVEEWYCTHLPTSFINNTMSDMCTCNNTTAIVEEHGMSLMIISLAIPLVVLLCMDFIITDDQLEDFDVLAIIFFFCYGILMFAIGCSAVSRLITFPATFYTIYILINTLPLLFCYIDHKNTFIRILLWQTFLSNYQNWKLYTIVLCIVVLFSPFLFACWTFQLEYIEPYFSLTNKTISSIIDIICAPDL